MNRHARSSWYYTSFLLHKCLQKMYWQAVFSNIRSTDRRQLLVNYPAASRTLHITHSPFRFRAVDGGYVTNTCELTSTRYLLAWQAYTLVVVAEGTRRCRLYLVYKLGLCFSGILFTYSFTIWLGASLASVDFFFHLNERRIAECPAVSYAWVVLL